MMAREALAQQREYEDGVKYSMTLMKREAAEGEARKAAAAAHREKLQAQFEADEQRRKQQQASKFEEGKRFGIPPLASVATQAWTHSLPLNLFSVFPRAPALPSPFPAFFDAFHRLREEFAAERAKLEAIRDHMVAEMERKGVNPKYLSEMKMTDIKKMQMR